MNFELLKKLSEAAGVPSREEKLREIVKAELGPFVKTIETDAMGNVICFKPGGGKSKAKKKVMIAAHMDEIGFLVRFIDDKGFLRLQTVGGFDPRQLFAQRVAVHAKDGDILRGVLTYSTKPTHMLTPDEAKAPPVIENFFVDLGMKVDEVKKKIRLGDMVTMDRSCEKCGDNIIGKCLDNRVGVFVMLEAIKTVGKHDVDIYAVATTQEEVGLRGAGTSAYAINPDIGVALDTTLANDYAGMADSDAVTKLGAGVGIKIMDGSFICHPKLVDHFRAIAETEKITHQMEVLPRGGTDGAALQRARGGVPSITLSVPTRYIHTVNEMICGADAEAAIALLARFLEQAHTGNYQL